MSHRICLAAAALVLSLAATATAQDIPSTTAGPITDERDPNFTWSPMACVIEMAVASAFRENADRVGTIYEGHTWTPATPWHEEPAAPSDLGRIVLSHTLSDDAGGGHRLQIFRQDGSLIGAHRLYGATTQITHTHSQEQNTPFDPETYGALVVTCAPGSLAG